VLGLYAWRTSAGYQARLASAAEMAAMCARLIEERIDRVFAKGDKFDLAMIEPLLVEAAGTSGIAAILDESGQVVTAQPPGRLARHADRPPHAADAGHLRRGHAQ
jgi:hypothetical protein